MSEIAFDKYQTKGAYHWTEVFGPVHRLNAYTMARYELIIRALRDAKIGRGDKVLDVGCGDAALSGLVAMRMQAEADGIDTSPLSIEIARREFAQRALEGRFAVIGGYTYPYDDGHFRAVICSDVIEHVQKPDSLLLEMWRVLAPGGALVVTTPVRYTEAPLDRMHVREWFPSEFRNLCSRTLGVDVDHAVSHPAAFAEFYASPTTVGRVTRLLFNVIAKFWNNPFLWSKGFRAFSTQIVVARKPIAP
jgi:2-polyprenyl-3-methyl-5-hydroxy-6-metoxy-1,4-benzoquinol methylase